MGTTSHSVTIANTSQADGYVQADGFYSPIVPGQPFGTGGTYSKGPAQLPFGFLLVAAAYTANSGGVQTGATPITTAIANFTTVGGAGYSALLPACNAYGDLVITVINSGANNLAVFAAGTNTINGGSAGGSYLQAPGTVVEYIQVSASNWVTQSAGNAPTPEGYSTNSGTGAITLTTANVVGGTVQQSLALTGAQSGGVAATTPTGPAWIAAIPNAQVGQNYKLRVLNSGSSQTITFTANATGVTVTGTATIANNTWREFIVTVATATTITCQEIGGGSVV